MLFKMVSADKYVSDEGHTFMREYGKTPNGNDLNGRWVLRSPTGEWIDHDQYRHDLAPRHDIQLEREL